MSLQHRLRGHAAPVTALTYLPSSPDLLSGDEQGRIRLWSASTRRAHLLLPSSSSSPSSIISLSAPSSSLCIAQHRHGVVAFHDLVSDQILRRLHSASHSFCRFVARDEDVVAIPGEGMKIDIHSLRSRSSMSFELTSRPMSLAWVDATTLATGDESGQIGHHDIRHLSRPLAVLPVASSPLFSIAWNTTISAGVAGSYNRIIKTWQIHRRDDHNEDHHRRDMDDEHLRCYEDDGRRRDDDRYHLDDDGRCRPDDVDDDRHRQDHDDDGGHDRTEADDDGARRTNAPPSAIVAGPDIVMERAGVNRIALRSDQRLFAVCTWTSSALIFAFKTRRLVARLDDHHDKISDVALSDPEFRAAATACRDHSIAVYRLC